MSDDAYTITWDEMGVPHAPDGRVFGCEVCGHPNVTITVSSGGQYVLCWLCADLIKDGMLREEAAEDGSRQYRQWESQPMKPSSRVYPAHPPASCLFSEDEA